MCKEICIGCHFLLEDGSCFKNGIPGHRQADIADQCRYRETHEEFARKRASYRRFKEAVFGKKGE